MPRRWVRVWKAFVFEFFGRQGYFSLRPLPVSDAERREHATEQRPPQDITRLNLDESSRK